MVEFWKKKPQTQPKLLPLSARSPQMDEAMAKWQAAFYGQPHWLSHKRQRSLNLAAASTQYLARLVCAELHMKLEGGKRATLLNRFIEEQLLPVLPAALQQAMVGSAVALKPTVQQGKLSLEWLRAEQFYPVLEEGREKMAFLSYVQLPQETYLRVELHGFEDGLYRISNKAYLCDSCGKARKQVSLEKLPQWRQLPEELLIEGLNSPLYSIWAMPFSNNVDGSGQAVSLYSAAMQTMEDMDRLYNDYCYEFESARRKMILREDALRMKSDGSFILPHSEGAADVYLPLDLPGDSAAFGDYTPAIREGEYRQAINQLLRLFEMQCGLSAGSFSMEQGAALTATEVIAKDRKTYYTVKEIQQQGRSALTQLMEAADALCSLYALADSEDWSLQLSFGDGIFEDTDSEFQRRLKLVELGMKPELLLAWYFERSEDAAAQMMNKEEKNHEFIAALDGAGENCSQ